MKEIVTPQRPIYVATIVALLAMAVFALPSQAEVFGTSASATVGPGNCNFGSGAAQTAQTLPFLSVVWIAIIPCVPRPWRV